MAGRLTEALLGFSESVKSFPFLPILCDRRITVRAYQTLINNGGLPQSGKNKIAGLDRPLRSGAGFILYGEDKSMYLKGFLR